MMVPASDRAAFLSLTGIAAAALAILIFAAPAWGAALDCLGCHDDYLYRRSFTRSVHGDNGCTSCHRGITNKERHSTGEEKPARVDCGSCHDEIARQFQQNFHYLQLDFRCNDCHRNIHAYRRPQGKGKQIGRASWRERV